jgi:hypothetical protein
MREEKIWGIGISLDRKREMVRMEFFCGGPLDVTLTQMVRLI